jgi:excisionase family DNA binding protein
MSAPNDYEPIAVNTATAKKISGLGNTTIFKLIKDGDLKSTKIGRRRLIDYASLKRLLGGRAA